MRILHTADWHLGHLLRDLPRDYEHQCFLNWLLETMENEAVDALLVAGDIFDTANPSSAAQEMYYRFLADAHKRLPHLNVLIVGGNHDSPARLDAPREILQRLNIHVIGAVPDSPDFAQRLLVPLRDRKGRMHAWVAAVPYLRSADLPVEEANDDPVANPTIKGVRDIYSKVVGAARERLKDGEFLLATGHCYLCKALSSPNSERRIVVGNEEALPADIFPDELDYVALGHLHCPQRIGDREIRYSGSPIPLDISEAHYPHQVLLIDLDGKVTVTPKNIPKTVSFLSVPREGPRELSAVLELLKQLPPGNRDEECRFPFLEVRVQLSGPEPLLNPKIEEALARKAVRLVKITRSGNAPANSVLAAPAELKSLNEEDVFRQLYERNNPGQSVSGELLGAFRKLLEEVRQREELR